MALHMPCPSCGKALRVPEKLAGQAAPCPNCKTLVRIPIPVVPPSTVQRATKQIPPPACARTQPAVSPPPLPARERDILGPLRASAQRGATIIRGALARVPFVPRWVLPSLAIAALIVGVGTVAFLAGRSAHVGQAENAKPSVQPAATGKAIERAVVDRRDATGAESPRPSDAIKRVVAEQKREDPPVVQPATESKEPA
jgi:hypothetical protein